jgi:hypothetical protein
LLNPQNLLVGLVNLQNGSFPGKSSGALISFLYQSIAKIPIAQNFADGSGDVIDVVGIHGNCGVTYDFG